MLEIKVKTGKTGWLGDILVSLSLANLMFLFSWAKLIYTDSYFTPAYTWDNWLSVIISVLLYTIFFVFALRLFRINKKIIWKSMLLLPLGIGLLIVSYAIRLVFGVGITLTYVENIFLWIGLIFIALICLLFYYRKQIILIIYISLLIFSPFALLNLFYSTVNIGLLLMNDEEHHRRLEPVDNVSAQDNISPNRKIIYIIFDELDYRIFSKNILNKAPIVELKNFQYMKKNTLFFTNIKNMWDSTLKAIPSITTGKNVIKTKPFKSPSPDIELTFSDGEKILWSKSSTLFTEIKKTGYRIGIVGWYHHYCELFNDTISYCSYDIDKGDAIEYLIATMIEAIPYYRKLESVGLHQRIEKNTFNALNNEHIDFIYIHDSIPHTPWIWNPQSKKYSINLLSHIIDDPNKLYLYNVQLADNFLGRIMDYMKEKGIWDASTIIIGSDHRWRNPPDKLLENMPLLIKFPMQKTGYQYDRQVLPTEIKAMIEQIAIHKVHDPVAFMQWLDQQPRKPLPTRKGDEFQ